MGLLVFAAFVALVALLVFAPFWLDRVVVFLMRTMRVYLFPIAIRIAYSLEREPEEWHLDVTELKHPTIGTIKFMNTAWDIRVDLPATNHMTGQRWKPSYIERRIICDAVNGLVRDRQMSLLDRTLPRLPM